MQRLWEDKKIPRRIISKNTALSFFTLHLEKFPKAGWWLDTLLVWIKSLDGDQEKIIAHKYTMCCGTSIAQLSHKPIADVFESNNVGHIISLTTIFHASKHVL